MTAARTTILVLAAIAALGSLATQLLVPALPLLARDLHSNAGDIQLVIGVFLVGLGGGQLVVGPLADRWGRAPVLLGGLSLYVLGSAIAGLAPSLPVLLAARLLQALGGSAGVVTTRVLVGDLFPPEDVPARQATLMGVILISPALAPVVGGALADLLGWRAVFALLALTGTAIALLAARALPKGRRRPADAPPTALAAGYARVLANPRFGAPALAVAAGSCGLYMYLGSAPFLLAGRYGLAPREVGLCLMLTAAASIAGTFLVARIERRGDAQFTGMTIHFAGGTTMLVLALAGLTGIAAFMGPTLLLGLGAGIAGPAGIARVVRSEPDLAGTATSLAGALQMLSSALGAWTLGRFAPVDATRLGLAEVLVGGLGCLAAGWLWHRQRQPAESLA